MGTINQDYIEEYIRDLINEDNSLLKEMEEYAFKNRIPIIYPEVKQLMRVLIGSNGINSILEVGTAIGYSSIVFSLAMGQTGHVKTIENNELMREQALMNISKAGLNKNIEVLFGDAHEVIYQLDCSFDCIFLDGAKGHYIHLLDKCISLLKPGGLLISDNVLFRGMIASDSLVKRRKITIVKRMRKYLKEISSTSRLITSIIPIGDGLAVSVKN